MLILWLFLFLFLFFNKTILVLLSKIFKKDIKVIKPEFWFIIRLFILFILIYYFRDIYYILNELSFIIKEFMNESKNIQMVETETIIIKSDEPLQGSEYLNSAYRKYYYFFLMILYHIFREFKITYQEEKKKKNEF